MKKFGFSISELLVTLGIVAVVSTLIAPIFSDIMPDKNKLKMVENYNLIMDINSKMLNSILYPLQYDEDENGQIRATCQGLECEKKPLQLPDGYNVEDFSGNNKYRMLFYLTKGETDLDNNTLSMADGSQWTIDYISSGNYKITIDVDGPSKGKNASYSANMKKNPDQYIFNVDKYGMVTGGDPLTKAYLANMKNTTNKKADYELAETFLPKSQ